ncbi:MAG: two pore domain potassium channel family protein [Flavobacteriales bacterium]|nr:two pore domain potassium channel family protein [Flavobacteriales bacterium]
MKIKDYFFLRSVYEFIMDKHYRNLLLTSTMIITVGTIVYHYTEGWSWVDSLYFSVVTLTTIGYGDFSPQTSAGKIFTIFYIILGLGMILGFINAVYEHYRYRSIKKSGKSNSSENPLRRSIHRLK